MSPEKTKYDNIVTFTHKDEQRHIEAALAVGREPDSHVPETSFWLYTDDHAGALAAEQTEARLRADSPKITRGHYVAEVASGTLPTGTILNPDPH